MKNITEKDMAYWWCQLNRFKFGGLKDSEAIGAMRFIEVLIGKDKCLAEWNDGTVPGVLLSKAR
jgi:hypothetical protein